MPKSWTITEIMMRGKRGLLAVPRTVPVLRDVLPAHCACPPCSLQPSQAHSRCDFGINSYLWGVVKMPVVFSHVEYCDMHFVYGFCDGSARAAVYEYQRRFPDRRITSRVYFLVFTRQCVRLFVFQVLLCSLKVKLTTERTFLRWFREVHDCPLVELPLSSACHVCRCGELYTRKIFLSWSLGKTFTREIQ